MDFLGFHQSARDGRYTAPLDSQPENFTVLNWPGVPMLGNSGEVVSFQHFDHFPYKKM